MCKIEGLARALTYESTRRLLVPNHLYLVTLFLARGNSPRRVSKSLYGQKLFLSRSCLCSLTVADQESQFESISL